MISPVYIERMSSILPSEGEPDYNTLIPNPTLRRRMSRVVKMGVACAMDCLAGQPTDKVQAIITATGLGCLADTEKFMNNLLDNNEQLLNPTAFIQSTFNTVGGQIALLCKNQSYNITYAHRGFSFESALLDGILHIHEGDECVLVGAFDEMTPSSICIQQRLGLYKRSNPGEGSQFFLLGKEKKQNSDIAMYAPYMFSGKATMEEIENRIGSYLHTHNILKEDISSFVTGDSGINPFPYAKLYTFKERSGEYHTASAFALWYAGNIKSSGYTLIYNQWNELNHSLILIKNY